MKKIPDNLMMNRETIKNENTMSDHFDYESINENDNSNIKLKNKKKKKKNASNLQIMNITYFFLLIFLGMIGYYIHFQLMESDEVINNAYNKREEILSESVIRGNILANDGTILAQTITNDDGTETRTYPFGALFAHSVGYSTHGQTGVELLGNYKLLTSNAPVTDIIKEDLNGEKHVGDNVITSLDVALTKSAYDALGNNTGAVIAIEPSTGKILTMVSKPDFDPNVIVTDYNDIIADDHNSNLLNRATSGLYTPGSTFKLFTLYEYIREHPDYENYAYECGGSISIEDNTIKCASGKVHGEESIFDSFAYSCNSSFVNMGISLDKVKYRDTCEKLLFNTDLPINYPYKASEFSLHSNSSTFETMQTAIGQGKTLVTPLHLVLIASSIANNGVLYKPYVITGIENRYETVMKTYSPEKVDTLFSPYDVEVLRKFLKGVIDYGTAQKLQSDLYDAYGKTGTAQIEDGTHTNSLFMGFAEKGDKKIAICVVMEDMPDGSIPAVPVAKAVFDTYFS